MVTIDEVRRLRYGSSEPLPERRVVRAGSVSAILEEGGLRYIRYGGREIVRGIYAAVRDRNWGTIKPRFRTFECVEQGGGFEVRFVAEHAKDDIGFAWEGTISGSADGTISFSFDGVAQTSFLRNRIGFCVLHPSELAGDKVEVETEIGTITGSFPERISPHQPFFDMKAIRHEIAPGATAELRFEGDLFEMEDQRNWTDASYKTYCTPLRLPYPVAIAEGERVKQRIVLRIDGEAKNEAASEIVSEVAADGFASVVIEDRVAGTVPRIGFAVTPGHLPNRKEQTALEALKVSFLRATLRLDDADWESQLDVAAANAAMLGAGLELETIGGESEGLRALKELTRAIADRAIPVDVVFAFPSDGYVGSSGLSRELIALRDRSGLGFRVGGGTRAYFTQLNRSEPDIESMEAVMYTLNPQVHAFDLSSIAETASAQADTVRSARFIVGGLPLSVGPITFKPRLNPDATSEEAIRRSQDRANHEDPRQASLFGAAWTLGSARYLAEAGTERAVYYETIGKLGLLQDNGERKLPLYYVFEALAPLQGLPLLAGKTSDPLACEAMAVRRPDGTTDLLLANYTDSPLQVRVQAPFMRPASFLSVDERGAGEDGNVEPKAYVPESAADGSFGLKLQPFAFAIVKEGQAD